MAAPSPGLAGAILIIGTTPPQGLLPVAPPSQWRQGHEYLVAVVARGDAERPRPAADHLPAEPAVEALEAGAVAQRQMELFEAHLLPGHLPGLRHQGAGDPPATEAGMRLQAANGPPVRHQR